MKGNHLIDVTRQTLSAGVLIPILILGLILFITCHTLAKEPAGKISKNAKKASAGMTWKDKFPYLWQAAYPDKSTAPVPGDVSYEQFVKAVAGAIRQDPAFLKQFMTYTLKDKVDLHGYMLNGYFNCFGMAFQYIKPGMFKMGSPQDEPGRDPNETPHQVILTKAFLIQTTEVTQGQWEAVLTEAEARGISTKGIRKNPSHFKTCGPDCPVESVSWDDVRKWIHILNQLGYGKYSLPTEAWWEYAARAGTVSAFANGNIRNIKDCYPVDPSLGAMGWYCGNAGSKTHPAAEKAANKWGLYDMHGNVWEWCRDWYDDYSPIAAADPAGPAEGSLRVLRGGSWGSNSWECRSAFRFRVGQGYRSRYFGFRLVMAVDE